MRLTRAAHRGGGQPATPCCEDRHTEKTVTQKGKEDVLLTGFQTCSGEIVVMLDADGSINGASFLVPCEGSPHA